MAVLNDWDLWLLVGESGACARLDRPDDMFPNAGDAVAVERAVAVCRACPVPDYCAERARRTGSTYGVWAGRLLAGEPFDGFDQLDEEEVAS